MTILTFILKSHLRNLLKQGQNKETWIHINQINNNIAETVESVKDNYFS